MHNQGRNRSLKKLKINTKLKTFLIPLSDQEFQLLEENLLRDGIREPLVLWKGTIIDGHNRYNIASKYGLPFRTEELHFDSLKEVQVWMIKNQLGKRNLSTFTRAEYALQLEDLIAEQAKKNQRLGQRKLSHNSDEAINTGKILGEFASCSRNTLFRVKKLVSLCSKKELEELREGELSINAAYNRVAVREHEQEIIKNKLPKGKFRVIYADPPWKYSSFPRLQASTALPPYPTMTVSELCEMKVKKLITPSSMLFLWTTSAFLEQAFEVMKAWGFKYTGASFVWVKTNPPFVRGNYNLVNHELLLVGKVDKSANFSTEKSYSVVEAPKGRHSEKPTVFYEIIEDLGYSGPKLELFARKKRKGWKSFGNEVE